MPFTLTMPKLSPTMEEGAITKWRKKEGEYVKVGEVIFEVATDKATVEHGVLDAGFLRKILIKEGETAVVNQAVAIFTEKQDESIEGDQPEGIKPVVKKEEAPAMTKTREETPVQPMAQPTFVPEPPLQKYDFEAPTAKEHLRSSPLAKKIAGEKGIDLSTIKGSGPQHRVMSRDLPMGQPDLPITFGRREEPTIPPGTYEEEPLTPMRKAIAQRLQAAKTFIPHFYVTLEIRAERLLDAHEQLKNLGHKVSINDFIIRATALALRDHPQVNSGFNSANFTLIRYKTIDISIAVSLEQGLITPIIRHADFKNLGQISMEIKELASRARQGKLERDEYMGGSFTISNLGMFGVSEFTAVINPPQAAILAVAAIEDRPVVEAGRLIPGKTMKLTLSGDHRVIDGVEGAKFLKRLQSFLENPAMLVI